MPLVSTAPTFAGTSWTNPAEQSHRDPPGSRSVRPEEIGVNVAVALFTQFLRIASAPKPWIAPLTLMSYQSAVIARRGMNRGCSTTPIVFVVAFSGFRFGLPPSSPLYCAAGFFGVLAPTARP